MASKTEIIDRLDIAGLVQELIPTCRPAGAELSGICPFHDDTAASLSINPKTGVFKCHACAAKGSIFDLFGKIHGLDFKGSITALTERAGLTPGKGSTGNVKQKETDRHDYTDEALNVLYQRVRLEPSKDGKRSKEYRFYDPVTRQWKRPCEPVLYHLPDVMTATTVFIAEGERKADVLKSWGLVGTCFDSGADSTITPAMIEALTSKGIIILPDNDEAGRKYRDKIIKAIQGKAASIKVVALPGLDPKGDIVDWVKTPGNDKARFIELVEQAVEWKPEPEEPNNSRIKVVDVFEFMSLEFPPRESILSPWLSRQGLTMVYAPRGLGKTHFSLGVFYAVISGGCFLGWQAPAARGVLFIDGEMPSPALQERIAGISISSDKEPTAPARIYTPDMQPNGMIDLSSPADQEALQPYLEGVELIIVDNLSTLCRSGKESEGEGWLPVQQWALQQRAAGRSVLFVHHSGKNGEQRGTSRREDVLDTVIALKRPGDYTPDMGACFEVHFEKARGLYGEETKPFEARLMTTPDNRQTWAMKPLEDSTAEKVAKLLNEGIPQHEIPDLLKMSKGNVSKAKHKAASMGLLNKGVS